MNNQLKNQFIQLSSELSFRFEEVLLSMRRTLSHLEVLCIIIIHIVLVFFITVNTFQHYEVEKKLKRSFQPQNNNDVLLVCLNMLFKSQAVQASFFEIAISARLTLVPAHTLNNSYLMRKYKFLKILHLI